MVVLYGRTYSPILGPGKDFNQTVYECTHPDKTTLFTLLCKRYLIPLLNHMLQDLVSSSCQVTNCALCHHQEPSKQESFWK